MEEKDYVMGFSMFDGIGPKRFKKLLQQFGTAEKAWEGSAVIFKKAGIGQITFERFDAFRHDFDIKKCELQLHTARVEFIAFGQKEYPDVLKVLEDFPLGLYAKGNKNLLRESQKIAVVGARKTTSYGVTVTESLVRGLVSENFIIVSGMALGVDAIAHSTAIENRGSTIAVLGCGVDCPFPLENEKLYNEILDSGGLIVSEYPLGMLPNKGTFPARNRIIAGLSQAVLITEAAEHSGSLITAEHALKQGKTVFAVPGPITSMMSRGALKLLKQGAILVQNSQDITKELGIMSSKLLKSKTDPKLKNLSKDEKKIVESLESEEKTIEELVRETKIPMHKLSIILSEMELKGLLKNSGGKFRLYE